MEQQKPAFIRFLEKTLVFDRRYIFLLVALAAILPTIFPFKLPVYVTHETRGVYDEIEKIPDGSLIFFTFDYEPASIAECDHLAKAILRQCLRKKLKIVATAFIVQGSGIGERILKDMQKEFNLKYGEDYAWLGYRAGSQAMIIGLGQNLKETFRNDVYGNPTTDLPILKNVNSLKDFPYLVCVHDDSYINYWIVYAYERLGIKIGSACTAIMASGMYPFLDAKQITGIVGGLKGASEYEKLIDYPDFGTKGMTVQSIIHSFIIVIIILGNLAYFILSFYSKKER